MLAAVRGVTAQTPLPGDARELLRADFPREALSDATLSDGVIPRAMLFSLRRDVGDVVRVDAFVRARPGVEGALRALAVRIGTRAGDWLTTQIPLDRLRDVSRIPGVRSVELARRARLVTDSSMLAIGATTRRRRAFGDQFEGATGRGVVVGFVDSGIDFSHPDFIEDDTRRSRIVSIWDQTVSGTGPAGMGFGYGRECLREELGAGGSCGERDTNGHGTHVAGIAVSDGTIRQAGGEAHAYPGVAPGAEIVMVKGDLSFTSIIDGIAYVFERARLLGLPAVVNLSLNTQLGPHDGDEAASLALDALSGPGRIVVAAAGNDGNNRNSPTVAPLGSYHAEGIAAAGDSIVLTFNVFPYTPRSGSGNDRAFLQAFYHPDDRFAVTVTRPNGTTVSTGANGSITANDGAGAVILYNGTVPGDSILGSELESGSFAPASTARVAEIYLGEWISGGAPPGAGLWKLTMHRLPGAGTGLVDAYIAESTLPSKPSFDAGATNRKLIGSPGDARTVITVGAYSTRTGWRAVDGNRYTVPLGDSVATGDLLPFSAPGPTRDGRLKPELSAPGRVFSTLASRVFFPLPLIAPDSVHLILEGTSMSTPHVTGAVALLLSRRPTLTPAQALAALVGSAGRDAFTARSFAGDAGVPNNSWGWGKLNVPGAIDAVSPAPGRALVSAGDVARHRSSSRRGTSLPLQRIRLSATDAESLSVLRLVMRVRGSDSEFRLSAVIDENHDGDLGPEERIVFRSAVEELQGELGMGIEIPVGAMVIPKGGTIDVVIAGELSGNSGNGAVFTATLIPEMSVTRGLRSGASRALTGAVAPPASVTTSVLAGGERFALSQNPVRTALLVMNIAERADRVEIYDFAGRRVRVMVPLSTDRSLRWDMRTDDGGDVSNGTYVIVVHMGSRVVRHKLFVAR